MILTVEVVFESNSFENDIELMEMLIEATPKNKDMSMVYNRKGRPIKLGNLLKKLNDKTIEGFSLETEEKEIGFSNDASHKFGHLIMSNVIIKPDEAADWLSIIIEHPNFLQARVYDDDYDTWQNATDLDYYKSFGKSLDGLKLVHNGSPPPRDAMEVDTSTHPGRKVFHDGYLEMLGSPMWFSKKMMKMVDGDVVGLKKLDWLDVTEDNANVVKLERKEGVFCSDLGQQKEQQNTLRSLLYRKVIEDPSQQKNQEYSDHATVITIDGETFVRKEK